MKKVISMLLIISMMLPLSVCAYTENNGDVTSGDPGEISVTTFVGDDGLVYEYIKYSDPVTYKCDGVTHTLLGKVRRSYNYGGMSTYDSFRQWTEWSIIDRGISKKWADRLSNPFYVTSVARGATKSYTETREVSIAVKLGYNIPDGVQSFVDLAMKGKFELNATGTYIEQHEFVVSGPDSNSPYNSRSFWYYKSYHEHDITVVKEVYTNWDGRISRVELEDCKGYEPAVYEFSQDELI